jgi:hypothetical protein
MTDEKQSPPDSKTKQIEKLEIIHEIETLYVAIGLAICIYRLFFSGRPMAKGIEQYCYALYSLSATAVLLHSFTIDKKIKSLRQPPPGEPSKALRSLNIGLGICIVAVFIIVPYTFPQFIAARPGEALLLCSAIAGIVYLFFLPARRKYRRLIQEEPPEPSDPLPPLTYKFNEVFRFDATHSFFITVEIYYSPEENLTRLDEQKLDRLKSIISDHITKCLNPDTRERPLLSMPHSVIRREIAQVIHNQKLFSTPLAFAIPHLTLEPTEKPKETKKAEESGYMGWS